MVRPDRGCGCCSRRSEIATPRCLRAEAYGLKPTKFGVLLPAVSHIMAVHVAGQV